MSPLASPVVPDEAPIEVSQGIDLLQASGTLHLSIPPNFFAAGSSAWTGNVQALGKKIGTEWVYELGNTSLILERLSEIELPLPATDPLRMVVRAQELTLIGTQPISVTVGGATQQWLVAATLSTSHGEYGSCDLVRTTLGGGTFTAALRLPLLLTFRRQNQIRVLDSGTIELVTSQGTWTSIAGSSTAPLAASRLPLGVALSSSTLTSSLLDLSIAPAAVDANRPGPTYVSPTALIDPAVGSLGRYCSIGDGSVIGAGAVIGSHASIGNNVVVGANAIVGDGCSIGDGATIDADAVIDSGATIMSNASVDARAVVGKSATLGSGCHVGADALLCDSVVAQAGALIGHDSIIDSAVQIGANATVGPSIEIGGGASIPANASQLQSIVRRILADGTVEYRSMPASTWPSALPLGVVQQGRSIGSSPVSLTTTTPILAEVQRVDPSNPPPGNPGYPQLPDDIGSTIAPPSNGGSGHEYNDDPASGPLYLCGWFAEQLRALLQAKGYSTTFTLVRRLNPDWKSAKVKTKIPKWIEAENHALTDIHWPDGKVTWIEAQFKKGDKDGNGTFDEPNLDGNGDGKVTYSEGDSDQPTDGDLNIQVYASRADAVRSGKNAVPGN